jgi:hypothetical protein
VALQREEFDGNGFSCLWLFLFLAASYKIKALMSKVRKMIVFNS